MSGGTLLVLGASHHQLAVIRKARDRGLRVAVADNVPSNPGHRLADISYVVDTTDVEAILRVARAERVAGVIAPCTDVAVPTAAEIARRLGLAGVGPETARVVTSKRTFRRWQQERGMPSPRVFAPEDVPDPANGRWIVKPDRSSGSKGIRIVEEPDRLAGAIASAREFCSDVIVEEMLDGHQITVEGIVREGKLALWVVLDRQTATPPWTATTGHRVPTELSSREARRAAEAVESAVEALGITDGPVDADIVLGAEPILLELSPRLGGNGITALVELATGLDLAALAVDAALGRPLELGSHAAPTPSAAVILGVDREGALTYDCGALAALMAEPWVTALDVAAVGTPVRPFTDGRAAVGQALVTGSNRAEVEAHVQLLVTQLALTAGRAPVRS